MSLSQGQVLNNRYRIAKLIGQGGFGAVYRAWDISLNQPCALKENLDTSQEAQRQFYREATFLASLRHPNLPRVTDHFLIPGLGQYLVMDFVEGQNLADLLAARPGIGRGGGAALAEPGRGRAGVSARPESTHHPPGHQAAEHHHHAEGPGHAGRLRHFQDLRSRAPHVDGRPSGDARLLSARAVQRRLGPHGCRFGHLRARRDPVHGPDRRAAARCDRPARGGRVAGLHRGRSPRPVARPPEARRRRADPGPHAAARLRRRC